MKILAAGDIHSDPKLVRYLAEKAERENVDLVILCGDLTLAEQDTSYIVGPFRARGKRVLLVPGNHESVATADYLAAKYDAKNLHGHGVKYDHIGFFGCGGANIGPVLNLTDHETFALLKKGFEVMGDVKKSVMVTHIHPADSKIEKFSQVLTGSKAVRKAIETFQPDFLLCGHVHEAQGIEEVIGKTRVINVCREGKIIDL